MPHLISVYALKWVSKIFNYTSEHCQNITIYNASTLSRFHEKGLLNLVRRWLWAPGVLATLYCHFTGSLREHDDGDSKFCVKLTTLANFAMYDCPIICVIWKWIVYIKQTPVLKISWHILICLPCHTVLPSSMVTHRACFNYAAVTTSKCYQLKRLADWCTQTIIGTYD